VELQETVALLDGLLASRREANTIVAPSVDHGGNVVPATEGEQRGTSKTIQEIVRRKGGVAALEKKRAFLTLYRAIIAAGGLESLPVGKTEIIAFLKPHIPGTSPGRSTVFEFFRWLEEAPLPDHAAKIDGAESKTVQNHPK
jgi:hypothetical protein